MANSVVGPESDGGTVTLATVDHDHPDVWRLLDQYSVELVGRCPSSAMRQHVKAIHQVDGLRFVLIWVDGEVAGCGALRSLGINIGEIGRMYVHPRFRGRGLGRRLLTELEILALATQYQCVRLDTLTELIEARALYASSGYTPVPRYNDNPVASHWFEKRMCSERPAD